MRYAVLLFLLFSLIVGIGSSMASDPTAQIEKRVQLMQEGLGLNDAQVAQLRTILTDPDIQTQRADTDNDQYKHVRKMSEEQLREDINRKIEQILTPEQRGKFQQMVKAKPVEVDKQLMELKEKLSLSENQLQSIELITITNRSTVEKIKQSAEKNPKQYHREMKKLMHNQAVEIEKLLTPEQLKAFREMRQEKERQMQKNRPRS